MHVLYSPSSRKGRVLSIRASDEFLWVVLGFRWEQLHALVDGDRTGPLLFGRTALFYLLHPYFRATPAEPISLK